MRTAEVLRLGISRITIRRLLDCISQSARVRLQNTIYQRQKKTKIRWEDMVMEDVMWDDTTRNNP